MKRVLTASEMREVDRLTVEEVGISSLLLMESAAAQVVRALESEFAPLGEHRVVVLSGKGANGGDGLAIARQLLVQGLAAEVQALNDAASDDPKQSDAIANLEVHQALLTRDAGGDLELVLHQIMGLSQPVRDSKNERATQANHEHGPQRRQARLYYCFCHV